LNDVEAANVSDPAGGDPEDQDKTEDQECNLGLKSSVPSIASASLRWKGRE
jgi:hypothetical protein